MYSNYVSYFALTVPVVFFVLSVIGFLWPKWRSAQWIFLILAVACMFAVWVLCARHPQWFLTMTDPETGETYDVDFEGSPYMIPAIWVPTIFIGYVLAWGVTWPLVRKHTPS